MQKLRSMTRNLSTALLAVAALTVAAGAQAQSDYSFYGPGASYVGLNAGRSGLAVVTASRQMGDELPTPDFTSSVCRHFAGILRARHCLFSQNSEAFPACSLAGGKTTLSSKISIFPTDIGLPL